MYSCRSQLSAYGSILVLLAFVNTHGSLLSASFWHVSASVKVFCKLLACVTTCHSIHKILDDVLCITLQESEYAAWTLVNGYNLNHAAVSVHRLTGLE